MSVDCDFAAPESWDVSGVRPKCDTIIGFIDEPEPLCVLDSHLHPRR